MKIIPLFLISCLTILPVSAKKIRLDECPAAVQETIRKNQRDGRIDEIESHVIQGKALYVAEIELSRKFDLKLHIAADGLLIKSREEIALADLPAAVRATVDAKLGGGIIDETEKETAAGKTEYLIEIERNGEPDLRLRVSPDGKVLSEVEDH